MGLLKKMVVIFSISSSYAQVLHHQAISVQSTSVKTTSGIHISQTIGQQSALGSFIKPNYVVQQGFQQSLISRISSVFNNSPLVNSIETKLYPNPVISVLNFEFSSEVRGLITITIFDLSGKLMGSYEKKSLQNKLTIGSLEMLPSGEYIVRLVSGNYNYVTKFLKK